MRFVKLPAFILLILSSFNIHGQYLKDSQVAALKFLEDKKEDFKKAKNDSLFIIKYSDEKFEYYKFSRGDQKEDIEEQIYSKAVGDVAGPFRGEDSLNFLFKIISYEKYKLRSKAKLIYIRSNSDSKQDSSDIRKLTNKYFEYVIKGKDIEVHSHKDNTRLIFKELPWFYEGDNKREYYSLVMNMKMGEAVIIDTEKGPAILQITHSKENAPYKVKLLAVIKRSEY